MNFNVFDFIVITWNILQPVNDNLIIKPGISLYWRSLYRDSAPYILLWLLLGKRMLIVIPRILLDQRPLNRGSTVNSMTFCWSHLCQTTNYFENKKIVHEYTCNSEIFTYKKFNHKIVFSFGRSVVQDWSWV